MQGRVILVRHGQSEWNLDNLFTGWRDPDLTPRGRDEALAAGRLLLAHGLVPAICFTSALKRAHQTLDLMLEAMGVADITIKRSLALNERDYGELSGLNKDEARARWGEEQVRLWRRSYDAVVPGGESLKMTCERVWPYYDGHIDPVLAEGGTAVVVAHGKSLRALVMKLEKLSPDEIALRELETGAPVAYIRTPDGAILPYGDLQVSGISL